jgi:ribosome recycling factor
MYNFKEIDQKLEDIKAWLQTEMRSIQTGRATPSVLDTVYVSAYGSKMQVSHLASVVIEDAKTLLVTPFDKAVIKDLEQGINDANLGLSVSGGTDGLRIHFPSLTTERRSQYVKIIKDKLEEARVRVRSAREDAKKEIEKDGKDGVYGKDDEKRMLETLQNKIDQTNSQLEMSFQQKEIEVMGE